MKAIILFFIVLALNILNVQAQNIITVAGNGNAGYSGDNNPATAATIGFPGGIIFDSLGNYYFSEINNTIRKVSDLGIITTIAGTGVSGFFGDSGPATAAQFDGPGYVAIDYIGNLYISDCYNNRVRKIDLNGTITTVAGNGTGGYNGDGIPATQASLYSPQGLAFDDIDNLYIADNENHRIRKVDVNGIISTIAGNGSIGYSGDGGIDTLAELNSPLSVHYKFGNLLISDGNKIRVINLSTGLINVIAGNGLSGFSGDSSLADSAKIWFPHDAIEDTHGNIYISDMDNNRIRKISPDSIITTIVGNGIGSYNGDGELAISAEINSPRGLTLDSCDNLYIVDNGNHRIRKVIFDSTCGSNSDTTNAVQNIKSGGFSVYPNPANFTLTLSIYGEGTTAGEGINNVALYNMLGEVVYDKAFVQQKKITIDISSLPNGVYFVKVNPASGGTYVEKVLKE